VAAGYTSLAKQGAKSAIAFFEWNNWGAIAFFE